jgi:hypothetical protein
MLLGLSARCVAMRFCRIKTKLKPDQVTAGSLPSGLLLFTEI